MTMTEAQLRTELEAIGLDGESHRAVALMPLVLVAWADKRVQAEERKTILEVARGHELLAGAGGAQVERWLSERPSDETFRRAIRLFVHLAHRTDGLGADLPTSSLDFVVELCAIVADAAGGILGMFQRTSAAERAAIRQITEAISAEAKQIATPLRGAMAHLHEESWDELLDELRTEEAPLPE